MISQEQLDQVSEMLAAQPIEEAVVNTLRGHFTDIHFTYCMDDDVVAASPVREAESFNLYLIDSRNHCLCFTREPEVATGIVVAEIA